MRKSLHTIYVLFLIVVGGFTALVIGIHGFSYYITPLQERPYHPQYESLKPTGIVSHGYGIIGSLMIIGGVALYSSRKRLRLFSGIGKLKYFLEFHIFLCLVGPLLILFHTTFKFGGLVAVSFWSMTAVALSGIAGRYLYIQLPKGIQGNELSAAELMAQNQKLLQTLTTSYRLSPNVIGALDAIALPSKRPAEMSLWEVFVFFITNDLNRRTRTRRILAHIEKRGVPRQQVHRMRTLANQHIVLTRRIAFLQQFHRLFHYWHVVHLPFSIVMFLILFIHVGVAIAFGYWWVW
jgi:hypothetical protein